MIVKFGKCYVCGHLSRFEITKGAVLLREAKCNYCGGSLRNNAIAFGVLHFLKLRFKTSLGKIRDKDVSILETENSGVIHSCLKGMKGYIGSTYTPGVISGKFNDGILNENLEELSFSDNKFDIVISQDVLEHVGNLDKAFSEINRVLKPGGAHIFTIPLHEGKKSLNRMADKRLPHVVHGDPLDQGGILVQTDFGDDIIDNQANYGFDCELIRLDTWYKPSEITSIKVPRDLLELEKSKDPLKFFKYNNLVFISRKI